jgi:hypothetical protein
MVLGRNSVANHNHWSRGCRTKIARPGEVKRLAKAAGFSIMLGGGLDVTAPITTAIIPDTITTLAAT